MKKAALALIMATLSGASFAGSETHVYCSNPDTLEWKWLPSKQKVKGFRKREAYLHDGVLKIRLAFEITPKQYLQLAQQCRDNFPDLIAPQPANHWYENWYTFFVGKKFMIGHDETMRALDLSDPKDKLAYSNYAIRELNRRNLERKLQDSNDTAERSARTQRDSRGDYEFLYFTPEEVHDSLPPVDSQLPNQSLVE